MRPQNPGPQTFFPPPISPTSHPQTALQPTQHGLIPISHLISPQRSLARSTMATGLFNSSSPPLQLATPPSRSPPPAAFLRVGQSLGSPFRVRFRLSRGVHGVGWSPGRKRLLVCCGVATVDDKGFPEEVLKSEVPVLVEFVADWCGPCRLVAPFIEWASQEYKGKLKVVKIDHDANPQLIEQYKVYGLPALILFKNGQEVPESRREGAVTKAKLKEYLDSLLESTAVA